MRRFWLLLLVFVLPLQMSWAATHFCDDDFVPVAAAFADAEQGAHQYAKAYEAGEKSDGQKSDQLTDCCSAAHGCHGLHHLMAQAEASLPSAGSAAIVVLRDTPSTCGYVATRVERPKWLAA